MSRLVWLILAYKCKKSWWVVSVLDKVYFSQKGGEILSVVVNILFSGRIFVMLKVLDISLYIYIYMYEELKNLCIVDINILM